MEEWDIKLMHRITKKGEVIQTIDIEITFVPVVGWDELISQHSGLSLKTSFCHETLPMHHSKDKML